MARTKAISLIQSGSTKVDLAELSGLVISNNCHPYSSYERGTNENLNKMIRRWFPKGTDFRQITAKAIQWVEDWINNYPREIHGFRSANSVFAEGVAMLI